MSGEDTDRSSRHQLVVLTLKAASHLPVPAPSYDLLVRAELSGVTLMSDPVTVANTSTSTSMDLEEQQLVWEVSQTQLRQFRSRKVLLRVELWIQNEPLGHFVIDLRTAQPALSGEEERINFRSYKILGSQVTVEAGLTLEDSDNISVDITEDSDVEVVSHMEDSPALHPTLVEESQNGEGGYFLIGERSEATETFSLSLSLIRAEHLSLVLDERTVLQDQYYWQYNIMGVDITSEQFPSLASSQELFESEKATATIKSSREKLEHYLSVGSINIKLCNGAVVVAAAELPLSSLLQSGHLQHSVRRDLELHLVSGHSLTVRQDKEGNKPSLGISLELVTRDDVITSGKLSDSEEDMEVEAEAEDQGTPTNNNSLLEKELSPAKLSPSKSREVAAREITPKKLKLSESPVRPSPEKISSSVSPGLILTPKALDTTDYLQLHHKTKPTEDSPKHYDLSVDLLSILIQEEGFSVEDAVLVYKYLALYKDPIKTETFSLTAGKETPVPNGYCQFSFFVGREKMISTFEQHLMKIALYVASEMLCLATINLAEMVKSGKVWRNKVDLIRRDTGKVMGQLEIELKIKERETDVTAPSKEKLVVTKDLVSKAVMDLETWKTEQKKKFNENLLNIEAQHLNLLGQEWKEREVERERVAQEKMAVMKTLEEELRQELEKIEIERREIAEKSKALEADKLTTETEKTNVKNNKVAAIDRLKHQLREKETEISMKNSEISLLSQKVKYLETEANRKIVRRASSGSAQEKQETLALELNQLRTEKLSWKVSLEQAQKEAEWYKKLFDEARSELASAQKEKEKMYSEKIVALERKIRELSGDKAEAEIVELERDYQQEKINVEIQTSINEEENSAGASMEGLMRLEEEYSMLLRTGVYPHTDPVVVQLREQIKKMRSKVKADKDS